MGCGVGKGGEGGRVARRLRCTCCCASTMHSARTFAWHFVSSLIVASSPSSALSLWISSACVISLHAPGGGEWPPERVLGGEVHRRAGRGDVACTHCATVSVDFVSPSCSLAAQVSPVLMAASRTDAARAAMVKDQRRTEWPAKARGRAEYTQRAVGAPGNPSARSLCLGSLCLGSLSSPIGRSVLRHAEQR